ncbi:MAG: hypothetical protein R2714_03285 [Microthrixaceae bacterium]
MGVILMAAALAAMLLVIVVALLVQRRQSHAPSRELIADGAFKPVDQSQAGTGAGWIQEPTWETAPGSGNAARDPRHERGDTPRPNPPAARNAGTEGGSGLFGERSGPVGERSGPVGEKVTSAFGGPPVWASAGSPGDPRPLEPAALEPAAQGTGLHGPPPLRPALGSAEVSAVTDGSAPDTPDLAGSAPPVSAPLAVAAPEPPAAAPPALESPAPEPPAPEPPPEQFVAAGSTPVQPADERAVEAESVPGTLEDPASDPVEVRAPDGDPATDAPSVIWSAPLTPHESRVVHRTNLVPELTAEVPTEWLLMTPVDALGEWPSGGMVPPTVSSPEPQQEPRVQAHQELQSEIPQDAEPQPEPSPEPSPEPAPEPAPEPTVQGPNPFGPRDR